MILQTVGLAAKNEIQRKVCLNTRIPSQIQCVLVSKNKAFVGYFLA